MFPPSEAMAHTFLERNSGARDAITVILNAKNTRRSRELRALSNVYDLARQRFTKRRTGTMYGSPSAAELGIEYLLTQ